MPPDRPDREELLRAALRQSRWSLALASLLLLGFFGAMGWLIYAAERGLLIREDEIVAEARERLARHADAISAEAGDLAADVLPEVGDALAEQVEADLFAYLQIAGEQGGVLTDHLADSLSRKSRSQYRHFLARHRGVLREELPQLRDEGALDRLQAGLDRALGRLLDRYYVDEFRASSSRLARAWQAIPPAEERPDDPPLAEQLLDAIGVWTETQFARPVVTHQKEGR